jgi:hypothetical protein
MAFTFDDSGEIKIATATTRVDLRYVLNTYKPNLSRLFFSWNAIDKFVLVWR